MPDEVTELPEPAAWMFRQEPHDCHNGTGDTRFVRGPCDGKLPGYKATRLYTAEQVQAAVLAERERAARVCDERVTDCEESFAADKDERWMVYAKHARRLAAAIRSGNA